MRLLVIGGSDAGIAASLRVDRQMRTNLPSDLDLSYTPPFGSPSDAIQLAAQEWSGSTRSR
jgi:hypothetical protein